MTIYAGENVDLKVRGTDEVSRKIITDANCIITLFAPPKNPRDNPADRVSPDHTVSAVYDSVSRYYLATVSTTGWAAGVWWMCGVVSGGTGSYYALSYESFTLAP